jgi:DNA (cytosine-5)-methyltransferase 1
LEIKPRLLDLFCKAGGATKGYQNAGFYVVCVDIESQPHYCGDKFYQADAMVFPLDGFDAYHASPPCQKYSMAGQQWRASGKEYADLIEPIRQRLIATGKPYVIENVLGAPLLNPVKLNGSMFHMRIRRTRLFETSFEMPLTLIPKEERSNFRMGRPVKEVNVVTPVGHFSNVPYVRRQMGIDWMTQSELAQAMPPAYTFFIGKYLMQAVSCQK